MSDIDFEELDKAVNSLVSDDKQPNSDSDIAKDNNATPPSMNEKNTDQSSPDLPSRRKGRFMDMKHASSDMKKDGSTLMTNTTTNIAPIHSDVKPDDKNDSADTKSDWPDPIDADAAKESTRTSSTNSTDMPDPLDHFDAKEKNQNNDKDTQLDKGDAEDISQTSPEGDKSSSEADRDIDESEKAQSPFLKTAKEKVEKRPLGGFTSEDTVISDNTESTDTEANKDSVPEEPIELPPELDKDLVAIEAGEAPEEAKVVESPDDTKEQKVPEAKTKGNETKDKVTELLASAASGSIPDQYKRENRSHELHDAHPLFNDEHFKTAPAGAPKKPKSKLGRVLQWMMIAIGIVLFGLILGGGAFTLYSQSI